MKKHLPSIIFGFFVLILLEYGSSLNLWSPLLFPRPSEVFIALTENSALLFYATLETLTSASLGLLLTLFCGVGIAMIFSFFPLTQRIIGPYISMIQTVPIIAIAPLLVVWFGFGKPTVIAASFLVSFFPILSSAFYGLNQTHPDHISLFKVYKVSRLKTFLFLNVPTAITYVVPALKVASGLSVIGAIIGEFIAGSGLGSIIDSARTQQRLDLLFCGIIFSAVVSFSFLKFFELLYSRYLFRFTISNNSSSTQ